MASETPLLGCADDAVALPVHELKAWPRSPARQQPSWPDPVRAAAVRADLEGLPGLVTAEEVTVLRKLLAQAAAGQCQVIQAGDCAEDPTDVSAQAVARRVGLLGALAGVMEGNTGLPVIRIGRIAGQFAKPRSSATEEVAGVELPSYRGHMINRPEAGPDARRPDPENMLACYHAARCVVNLLRQQTGGWRPVTDGPVWTSHEALVLDYELPFLRRTTTGQTMLASTHLPWIGERTRQLDGAHVRLLAEVVNPIACKIGPETEPHDLVRLCERLAPGREPGRLTLITRMGADRIGRVLPELVRAVGGEGHQVVWLCDPMHGNTVRRRDGRKTRVVSTLIDEIVAFQQAVSSSGGIPGGLHLETTPEPVTECTWTGGEPVSGEESYTSLCDPRLNPGQALAVVGAWLGGGPSSTPLSPPSCRPADPIG